MPNPIDDAEIHKIVQRVLHQVLGNSAPKPAASTVSSPVQTDVSGRKVVASGEMKPAGLRAIDLAKQDGRWDKAYEGQKTISVPEDFQAALVKNKKAKAFFDTLNSVNRYAILFRIHNAKKPETRAKRIEQFVEMLERGEKINS